MFIILRKKRKKKLLFVHTQHIYLEDTFRVNEIN